MCTDVPKAVFTILVREGVVVDESGVTTCTLCSTCHGFVENNRFPGYSIANGYDYGRVDNLPELSLIMIEKIVISPHDDDGTYFMLWLETVMGTANIHRHTSTCRKGPLGVTRCRLAFGRGSKAMRPILFVLRKSKATALIVGTT